MTGYVPVFAHAGHVVVDLIIFLGPVAVLAGTLAFMNWRDRRSGRGGEHTTDLPDVDG